MYPWVDDCFNMTPDTPIAIIGLGHLGSSIAKRLIRNGHKKLVATRRNENELQAPKDLSPHLVLTTDNEMAVKNAAVIILATKEASFEDFAAAIKAGRQGKLLISLGPTFKLNKLDELFGGHNVRLITPVDARNDVICYSTDSFCSDEDEKVLHYIFGECIQKVPEEEMPLATAFVLFRGVLNSFLDPFIRVAAQEGLDAQSSQKIMGEMLISCGEELRDGISSEKRLENASGGFNEKSFTMRLYKELEPAQVLLKDLFEKVCKQFKNL